MSRLAAAAVFGLVAALPASEEQQSKRQISLPGSLIPKIPGVTDILSGIDLPLPILQLPTPPLDSPPYTPSNIKPKKIGYFWTGAGDNKHADFLASYSLDDVSLPTLVGIDWTLTLHHTGHFRDSSSCDRCPYIRKLSSPSW